MFNNKIYILSIIFLITSCHLARTPNIIASEDTYRIWTSSVYHQNNLSIESRQFYDSRNSIQQTEDDLIGGVIRKLFYKEGINDELYDNEISNYVEEAIKSAKDGRPYIHVAFMRGENSQVYTFTSGSILRPTDRQGEIVFVKLNTTKLRSREYSDNYDDHLTVYDSEINVIYP